MNDQYGYTVRQLARRWCIGPDKVRTWIKQGTLRAINVASHQSGKPQWCIPPEAVEQFERVRSSTPPPKPPRRRRKTAMVDYYPGDD